MDNPNHNHVILIVGNTILENNLDADNKIRYISVFTLAKFNFMKCTYPVRISFVCSECNSFRKLNQLLEYFEKASFPDYKTSILTDNWLILNKL